MTANDPNRQGREPALMTMKEACEYLSMAKSTLYKVMRAHGLKRVKLGRCCRWRVSDLNKLIERGGRGR